MKCAIFSVNLAQFERLRVPSNWEASCLVLGIFKDVSIESWRWSQEFRRVTMPEAEPAVSPGPFWVRGMYGPRRTSMKSCDIYAVLKCAFRGPYDVPRVCLRIPPRMPPGMHPRIPYQMSCRVDFRKPPICVGNVDRYLSF